jgi:NAD(P)-dependent dehydrogenase (short-subunit alcohol dehydrogenase family)
VVTGGASGIGRALALTFAREGARVVLGDRDEAGMAEVAAAVRARGGEVLAVPTDVSELAQVQALAERAYAAFGAVHVLCNNAGVAVWGGLETATHRDWQWVLGINLWGVIHGVEAFVPRMIAQKAPAHIVNTASMAGLVAFAGAAPYCASKFAVVGLSESLQQELAKAGADVGVSVLCPGFVKTNIFTSQRNRPAALTVPERGPRPGARSANDEIVRNMLELGIAPEAVADEVLAAITERRFWIFTHPDLVDAVDERHGVLLADRR